MTSPMSTYPSPGYFPSPVAQGMPSNPMSQAFMPQPSLPQFPSPNQGPLAGPLPGAFPLMPPNVPSGMPGQSGTGYPGLNYLA